MLYVRSDLAVQTRRFEYHLCPPVTQRYSMVKYGKAGEKVSKPTYMHTL